MNEKKTELQLYLEARINLMMDVATTWNATGKDPQYVIDYIREIKSEAIAVVYYVWTYENKTDMNEVIVIQEKLDNACNNSIKTALAMFELRNKKEEE